MGSPKPEGHEFQAANGYWYVKQNGKYRLKHHVIAEEKYGHPVDSKVHRVYFVDGDRENLDPSNIEVAEKQNSKQKRIETLKARIAQLEEELKLLEGN